MIFKKILIALTTLLTATSVFAAPGIKSIPVLTCQSSPSLKGDVGQAGQYSMIVTNEIREYRSFYQAQILDKNTDTVISTLRGAKDDDGVIELSRVTKVVIAGSLETLKIDGARATWTKERDFGPSKSVGFICLKADEISADQ